MDKFAKRLQSRLSAKGYPFNKEQCRQALAITAENPELPTDDEMIAAFDYLTQPLEPETVKAESVSIQPLTSDLQPLTPETEAIAPAPLEKIEDSSLTLTSDSSITQPSANITPAEVTQAINQAVAQVGQQGNSEAIELLTSLANELSTDIKDVQEMASALITAYLGKRQNILASAIGTVQTLRSAQTSSFQAGLNQDFFDQKDQAKRQFLTSLQGLFN